MNKLLEQYDLNDVRKDIPDILKEYIAEEMIELLPNEYNIGQVIKTRLKLFTLNDTSFKDRLIKRLVDDLEALREQTRWRSVEDELPEKKGDYLCKNIHRGFTCVAEFQDWNNEFCTDEDGEIEVTHWQPLSPEPEEK